MPVGTAHIRGARRVIPDAIGRLHRSVLAAVLRIPARPLYALCALVLLPIVVLSLVRPEVRNVVDASNAVHGEGFAYFVGPLDGLTRFGLLEVYSDSSRWSDRSSLQLLENGSLLGPANSPHQEIRAEGLGRYSHWTGDLYFSSSDNTDPRTNQRSYEVVGRLALSPWLYVAGSLLLVLGGYRRFLSDPPRYRRVFDAGIALWFRSTGALKLPRWAGAALLVAGFLAGPLALFFVWRSGATINLALAGLLPMSDAGGYFWCADNLIYEVSAVADPLIPWCYRRPIYTVFLSSLTMIFDRDLHLVLLAQAALLSLTIAVFMREVGRWLGILPGVVAGVAGTYLMAKYGLAQVTSEVIGLVLGLTSIAVLLRAGALRAPNLALIGLGVLSVALNARPGAVFALPAVALWVGWLAWQSGRGGWRYLAMAVGAVGVGFLIHGLLVGLVGGTLGGSHGNFALVLYGLSVGGDWRSIIADHPSITESSAIYGLAIGNILANPVQFLSSLLSNLLFYFDQIHLSSEVVGQSGLFIIALAVTAWRARRDLRAALFLALCIGEIASAPFVASDGNLRALVVTASSQVVPILVMLNSIAAAIVKNPLEPPSVAAAANGALPAAPTSRTAISILVIVGLLWIPAVTPLRLLSRAPMQFGSTCAAGLYPVVTVLDAGGPWLTLTPQAGPPQLWPRRIGLDDFHRGIEPSAWFAESVLDLPPMFILLARQHLQLDYGRERWLYYAGSSALPVGRRLLLCADRNKYKYIVRRPFWEVVSFQEL